MITCADYDYVEIACLYKIRVQMSLSDGRQIEGVALTTKLNDARQECLVLGLENQDTTLVILSETKTMTAVTANPHFDAVAFNLAP